MSGPTRQQAIYLGGVSGIRPRVPADATKLEERARRSMSRSAFAYITAGAGAEQTGRANREGVERRENVPRLLRGGSGGGTSGGVVGQRLKRPVFLAPAGG